MEMNLDNFKKIFSKSKKKIVFIILLLLFLVLIIEAKDMVVSDTNGIGNKNKNSSLTISQPERVADVYGMITSVKGNKITLLKFDVSTMPGAKQNTVSEEESEEDGNIISLGSSSSSMPGSGTGPGGGMGGGPGGFGESSSSSRQEKLEDLKTTSIGTETIEVPVGIPILISESGQALESGTLRDLSSDTLVAMWLEEESETEEENLEDSDLRRVASFVSVTGKVDMDN